MSVIVFSNEELTGLIKCLREKNASAPPWDIQAVVLTLGGANRLAAATTTNTDAILLPTLSWAPCKHQPKPPRVWCETLLYNCLSDSGVDFAPASFAIKLLEWAGFTHEEARLRVDPEKLVCTRCGWRGDVLDLDPFKPRLFKCLMCARGIEHTRGA